MSMRAIVVSETGGPEVLKLAEVPVPVPGPGQVLVRHEAIGVNFIDVYFREGLYPAPLPFTPGQEAAGVVDAVGDDVRTWAVGDRVAYAGKQGSYAEFAVIDADALVAVPDGVSSASAAALMLQGMTAHYLVTSTYRLGADDLAVVLAAAGGLGRLLVQVATHVGATVVGVTSSDAKAALVREAGAGHVVVHGGHPEILPEEVRRIGGGVGANVVYDSVGAATFDASLASLRPRGTLVLLGQSSGPVPPFEITRLSAGSLTLVRPRLGDYLAHREELTWRAADVFSWLHEGVIDPDVNDPIPLAEVGRAHEALADRNRTGKLLLVP